jgi:hypothetical protein
MIRSADAINADIRRLWAAGTLRPEDRDRYARLVVEWERAVRAELPAAA